MRVLAIDRDSGPAWDELLAMDGQPSESFTLDLSDLNWVSPMLVVRMRAAIKSIANAGFDVLVVAPKDVDKARYCRRTHLLEGLPPDACGTFPAITEHDRHTSMIPVLEMKSEQAVNEMASSIMPVIEALVGTQGAAAEPLAEAFTELSNNAVEHSGSELGGFVAGQRFPSTRRLELAVFDLGIGIPAHMRKVHSDLGGDAETILHAMQLSVSGTSRADRGIGFSWITDLISEANDHSGSIDVTSGCGRVVRSINGDHIDDVIYAQPAITGTLVRVGIWRR